MENYQNLAVHKDGKITTIEIKTQLAGKNYISMSLMDDIDSLLDSIDYKETAILILKGNRKAFSLGAAISEYADADRQIIGSFIDKGNTVFDKLSNIPAISIAAIQGYALGGGFELALSCDLMVLSNRAKLGLVETNIGIIPGWGGFYKLAKRAGLNRALEYTIKGSIMDAEKAFSFGIANAVFENSEFESKLSEFCSDILSKDTQTVMAVKKLYNQLNQRDKEYFGQEKESFLGLWNENSKQKIKNITGGS